jgi:hypothetical protein
MNVGKCFNVSPRANVPENVYAYIKGQNTVNSLECGRTRDGEAMEDATSDLIYSDASPRQNIAPYYLETDRHNEVVCRLSHLRERKNLPIQSTSHSPICKFG